ncbi:MAG: hypothetical protein Q9215_003630 [Flavoplaca cf. flavocitrina]
MATPSNTTRSRSPNDVASSSRVETYHYARAAAAAAHLDPGFVENAQDDPGVRIRSFVTARPSPEVLKEQTCPPEDYFRSTRLQLPNPRPFVGI